MARLAPGSIPTYVAIELQSFLAAKGWAFFADQKLDLIIKIMFHPHRSRLKRLTAPQFSDLGLFLCPPKKAKSNFGVCENQLISPVLRFISLFCLPANSEHNKQVFHLLV